MNCSPYDLAQMAVHDAVAAERFPGPDYYEVLRWIHEALKPSTYVEIGVLEGHSLKIAQPPTFAVGIDPSPFTANQSWPANTLLFHATSTEFFARYDLAEILGGNPVDFAFVDGLHCFEQVLEDLMNLERYSVTGTLVALHDTYPLDHQTSQRTRATEFYTGDVWKVVPFLRKYRPDLEIITVRSAPSGLSLIRGWAADCSYRVRPAQVAGFSALDFDYFVQHHSEFLGAVANDRAFVQAFCQNIPVQSISSSGVVISSLRR